MTHLRGHSAHPLSLSHPSAVFSSNPMSVRLHGAILPHEWEGDMDGHCCFMPSVHEDYEKAHFDTADWALEL